MHDVTRYVIVRYVSARRQMARLGCRRWSRLGVCVVVVVSAVLLLTLLSLLVAVTPFCRQQHWRQFGFWMTVALSNGSPEAASAGRVTPPPPPPSPMLCLFTTLKPVEYKTVIHQNVIRNWAVLSPSRLRPILFVPANDTAIFSSQQQRRRRRRHTDDDDDDDDPTPPLNQTVIRLAASLGWTTLVPPRTNDHNIPHLKEMFADVERLMPGCVFYGYANGDVLFDDGLLRTLEAVAEVLRPLRRTLVVGRRTNFEQTGRREVYLPSDVELVARTAGRLFISDAQDYFFMTSGFPWSFVPDVIVGRPGYDNFLVATAIRRGVSVVDATRSVTALHQTDRDGNFAGHDRNNSDRDYNLRAIGKRFRYHSGHTTRSQFVTQVDRDDGTVTVHRRYSRRRVWSSFWKQIGFS